MARQKGQEQIDNMVETLRKWQKIERQAVETTAGIMEKTSNKLIWQIMEIIRNDSVQHHRVQGFIIDTLTTTPISLTPDELGEVWQEIEAHDEVERDIIKMAKELRDNCPLIVQRQLIDYLIYDEEKHDKLLTQLNEFKKKVSGPA